MQENDLWKEGNYIISRNFLYSFTCRYRGDAIYLRLDYLNDTSFPPTVIFTVVVMFSYNNVYYF